MTTLADQVIAAVETALSAASAGLYEDYETLGADVSSGIVLGEWVDTLREVGMVDEHTIALDVGVFARGPTARATADALRVEVYGLMMADRSFGGLVRKLTPGATRGSKDGTGSRSVLISQQFTLQYMTQRGSLTVAA